ncbi:MAG: NAD(P)H-hydrate dehydratase [Candidatus Sericytochromatia bacterium]|nr:NAD(P)H-hydrate dehydratase [Candidatus Sericytochromatia bacterium]
MADGTVPIGAGDAAATRRAEAVLIEAWQLPAALLMERVALAAVGRVRAHLPPAGGVVVLAGPGHNGADGLALARLVALQGVPVMVHADEEAAGTLWRQQADWARRAGVAFGRLADWRPGSEAVLVDALLGFGASRVPVGAMADALSRSHESTAWRLALDLPTGLQPATGVPWGAAVFHADETLATGIVKQAVVADAGIAATGSLGWVDIGLPPDALALLPGRVIRRPVDPDDATTGERARHKGTRGRVLVLGGGPGMPGAPAFAALAAMRAGAGLVEVLVPEDLVPLVAEWVPEALVRGLPPTAPDARVPPVLLEALGRVDAVVAGPGTMPGDSMALLARSCYRTFGGPVLLDGGALDAHLEALPDARIRVLTPHPGEAARILGTTSAAIQADRFGASERLVATTRSHVVLKGARPIVRGPDGSWHVMAWGEPALATAGSGDVLAGLLGAALAEAARAGQQQRAAWDDTISAAVALHQQWGHAAAAAMGERGVMARDLLTWSRSGPAWWPAAPGPESMWTRLS